ncbi:MAG: aryl-sulfate sulfotransferase [Chitinophagaceae bacterium]
MKNFCKLFAGLFLVVSFASCSSNDNIVKEIKIGLRNDNQLKIQMDLVTTSAAEAYAEYWLGNDDKSEKFISPTSKNGTQHSLILCNIIADTTYYYHIVTVQDGKKTIGKTHDFKSPQLPMWMQEQFKYSCISPEKLPSVFKSGFMLLNKRENPGISFIVDYKGRIRWYHMVNDMGTKVSHFTDDKTILSILGTKADSTSYGSEILEVNLLGDTVAHVKKGQGDFKFTIHHEILRNSKHQLTTLFVDKRLMDLSAVGGSKADTVTGDGIVVMDDNGKKISQWSVFDVMDPLKDPKLMTTKKDWMHANSLNFDSDGNYIISFYNNGQIWKVDAKTGAVIWKFGRGGTFTMPSNCDFTQAHAVHINKFGSLMFFDNGVEKKLSEVFAVNLNEAAKTAQVAINIKLPEKIYNDRMGSAYMINDTSVLCCSSKRHIAVLATTKGDLLWTLEAAFPSYRMEFMPKEKLAPFISSIE